MGGYRIPVDVALLRRKDDAAYQTEHALFRQMVRDFRPPAWCQEIIVVADAAYASRPNMALIQALGYWYVFALPRPWNCTTGESLKALVTHLPRWWYTRICMPTVNGQRQRTFWVDAKRVRLRHLGDVTVVRSTCRRHDGPKQTKILVIHRAETVSARQMVAIMASLLLLRLQATHIPANRPWSAFQLQRQFMWDVLQAQGERSARQLARKWLPDGQSGMRTFTYLSLLSKYRMGQDDGNDGE